MNTDLISNRNRVPIAESRNNNFNVYYEDDDVLVSTDLAPYLKAKEKSKYGEENRLGWTEIVFCLNGSAQWELNGTFYQTLMNSVVILPSRFVVEKMMVSLDAKMIDVCLSNQMLNQLLDVDINKWHETIYQGVAKTIVVKQEEMDKIVQYFELLKVNQSLVTTYYSKVVHSFIQIILYTLLNEFQEQDEVVIQENVEDIRVSNSKRLFDNFLTLLNQSKPKRHPIGYFAARLSVTPKYLSNLCMKYSDKTASDWIQEAVQEEIRYYLKQTLLSMKEVARVTGFDNVAFFGKYVKHHFGCTPMTYRRNNIKN